MNVRYLRRALDKLQEHIARDNPVAAHNQAMLIRQHITLLAEQPRLGRPGRNAGTRELVIPDTSYVVAYRVTDKTVDVLAIVHGRQSWPGRF